jgi:uncharacterized membrane protein
MHAMAVAGLVVIGVGLLLILIGTYMTLVDWKRKLEGKPQAERNALSGALKGLAKLVTALKDYPPGQKLIVWGIVLLFVGGVIGGVSGL